MTKDEVINYLQRELAYITERRTTASIFDQDLLEGEANGISYALSLIGKING